MQQVTVTTYRQDPYYPRVVRAVATILARADVVAPVDVLLEMGNLTPKEDVSKVLLCYDHPVLGRHEIPASWCGAMILPVLHGPNCQGTDIVRHGKTRQGKQRYRCREQCCAGRTFLLEYADAGPSPAVKQQLVAMAMNASGIRDTARLLPISPHPVLAEGKKRH